MTLGGLANKDDGTTCLTLFDQDIGRELGSVKESQGWYVKQVPRPLLAPGPSFRASSASLTSL